METTETETTETETQTATKRRGNGKIVNAPRKEMFMMEPEELVIVGIDTKDGPEHHLYDERIKLPLDENLTKNIQVYGVLKPVFVEKIDDKVYVVDGRRRVLHARAAKKAQEKAGEETLRVPVMFKRGEEAYLFGISRVANNFQAVDGPLSNARNSQRLLDMGKTEAEIAIMYGVKAQTVKDWVSLLDCAASVRKAVERNELSASAAASLAKLPKEDQEKHLEELKAQGIKPTVDNVISKKRQAQGKAPVQTPASRIKKARDILLKLGTTDATKDELIEGLDKISKALFSKGWDKLVAEAEADAE